MSKNNLSLKNLSLLHIGDQKSLCLDILFWRWVLFQFILPFLCLTFLQVINLLMWLIKSRETSWVTLRRRSQVSFKSHYWLLNDIRIATSTNSCWSERRKVDRGQDKFLGCISLVSIGFETMTVLWARACAKSWSALLSREGPIHSIKAEKVPQRHLRLCSTNWEPKSIKTQVHMIIVDFCCHFACEAGVICVKSLEDLLFAIDRAKQNIWGMGSDVSSVPLAALVLHFLLPSNLRKQLIA